MITKKTLFSNYFVMLIFGLGLMGFTASLFATESHAQSPTPVTTGAGNESDDDSAKYVVIFPKVPLRKKPPLDEENDYIGGKEEVLSTLLEHDIVKESDECESEKKSPQNDWLCVTFVRYGDFHKPRLPLEPEVKTGWIFRYSVDEHKPKPEWKILTQKFPPYTFSENGKVVSLMDKNGQKIAPEKGGSSSDQTIVNIIMKACDNAKIKKCILELREDWQKAQKEVKNGQAEGLFVIGEKVREYLLFSPKLTTGEYVFFVREDNPWKYNDKESLKEVEPQKITAYGHSSTCDALDSLMRSIGLKVT